MAGRLPFPPADEKSDRVIQLTLECKSPAECLRCDQKNFQQAIGPLLEVVRLAASLGSCVDLNGIGVHVSPEKHGLEKDPKAQEAKQQAPEEEERLALAEKDLSHMESLVAEAEAKVRNLRHQILCNNQTIDQLVLYRLLRGDHK